MAAPSTPPPARVVEVPAQPKQRWRKFVTPLAVVLLALAIVFTITRNWNSWEGGRIEQVTGDAYVRGDLTPLSTKVAGIVRDVKVSDFQPVRKGDLLLELEDDDYQAQVAQADAAVEAAKAAIENNRRQRQLQETRIDRALAGIDQANAETVAAQAGTEAAQADVVRTQEESERQEALLQTHSTTQQKVEAVADRRRLSAQLASREADLQNPRLSCTAAAWEPMRNGGPRRCWSLRSSNLYSRTCPGQVNLGYTKITAPQTARLVPGRFGPGQLVSPGTQVIPFVIKRGGSRRTIARRS
jgi:membrane fusion protein, multidrug efflux system